MKTNEEIARQAAEALWTYGDRETMVRANARIILAAIEQADIERQVNRWKANLSANCQPER